MNLFLYNTVPVGDYLFQNLWVRWGLSLLQNTVKWACFEGKNEESANQEAPRDGWCPFVRRKLLPLGFNIADLWSWRFVLFFWEKTVVDLTQPERGHAPILPDLPKTAPVSVEPKIVVQTQDDEVKKKRKKKKTKFGGNKKLQHLAKKWAVVDKERKKDDPEYKRKQEKRKNEKWVLEQSGRSAEDNPNLIKVSDWRSKVGLNKT